MEKSNPTKIDLLLFKFQIERWKSIHVIDLLKMGFTNFCSFVWNPRNAKKFVLEITIVKIHFFNEYST
jgi:hypothetical protein